MTPTRSKTCGVLATHLAAALVLVATMGAAHAEPRRSGLFEGESARYEATRAAIQRGQWQLALEALADLQRSHPGMDNEAEFHNLMGYVLRQSDLRQLPLAIMHYRKALAIDPSHVQAREYLGQAYLLQGRMDLAEQELRAIEHHCQGRSCEAWQDLAKAIAAASPRSKRTPSAPSAQP